MGRVPSYLLTEGSKDLQKEAWQKQLLKVVNASLTIAVHQHKMRDLREK